MTSSEKVLCDQLLLLKEKYHVTGVKAEYEAEGTRRDELLRLKDIALHAGVSLTLKIGGCDALRDIFDAQCIGAGRIVAPMIESSYALRRFIENAQRVFGENDENPPEYLINMETITCVHAFEQILEQREARFLKGIVVGRTDLTGSMNLTDPDSVNSSEIYDITRRVAHLSKKRGLDCTVGGKVTVKSLPFLNKMTEEKLLDRFETRKIIFPSSAVSTDDIADGIKEALRFELLWMKYKRDTYTVIAQEDQKRIADLEERMK